MMSVQLLLGHTSDGLAEEVASVVDMYNPSRYLTVGEVGELLTGNRENAWGIATRQSGIVAGQHLVDGALGPCNVLFETGVVAGAGARWIAVVDVDCSCWSSHCSCGECDGTRLNWGGDKLGWNDGLVPCRRARELGISGVEYLPCLERENVGMLENNELVLRDIRIDQPFFVFLCVLIIFLWLVCICERKDRRAAGCMANYKYATTMVRA